MDTTAMEMHAVVASGEGGFVLLRQILFWENHLGKPLFAERSLFFFFQRKKKKKKAMNSIGGIVQGKVAKFLI